ncbi:hypothetical protein POVWA2_039010 [Plasmodium ovale wallikeri]|uniref:Uncharacterized protein n=1 Tax=Plasmodium ovale wallikeri TaxID=864142 RepID=A0A1A8Z8B2_PLAOA|nr:hypothetical protein POVWA2_039010 [Plasmodium ovale wallikeri]
MVFPHFIHPDFDYHRTIVHRYSTTRPAVPLTAGQHLYTHYYYDNSATNQLTTLIFLILFLSLCYRLIDKMFFKGKLINSIFDFSFDSEEDPDLINSTIDDGSDDSVIEQDLAIEPLEVEPYYTAYGKVAPRSGEDKKKEKSKEAEKENTQES